MCQIDRDPYSKQKIINEKYITLHNINTSFTHTCNDENYNFNIQTYKITNSSDIIKMIDFKNIFQKKPEEKS